MQIRRMTHRELDERRDELNDWLLRAIADSPLQPHLEYYRRLTPADIARATDYEQFVTVVAEQDGSLAGLAIGVLGGPGDRLQGDAEASHPRGANGAIFLLWVAVATGHRAQGLASRLLDALEDTLGSRRMWGLVEEANAPARSLYIGRDWRILGMTRNGDLVMGRLFDWTPDQVRATHASSAQSPERKVG